jgi:hypothetical protein
VITLDELKIPKGLRPVVEEIVGITDSVCLSVLDEEYADLARRAWTPGTFRPASRPRPSGGGSSPTCRRRGRTRRRLARDPR